MRSVRVWFTKLGTAKYISHLDINRCMTRAVRRAHLPLWYTEGFNPHPYMTFSLPLPLGVESMCESMDIRIMDEAFSNDDVVVALNKIMPEGISVTGANDIEMKASEISFAAYLMTFKAKDNSAALVEKIKAAVDSGELLAEKKSKSGRKKVVKTINLSEYIKDFSVQAEDSKIVVKTILCAGINKNANPILVLDTVLAKSGIEKYAASILREKLFTQDMTEFK